MANFTRPRPNGVLRILTLNTWYVPPLEDRTREIAAWIDAVNPHIACLQEVRKAADGASLADCLAEHAPENGVSHMGGDSIATVYLPEML